MTGREPYRGYEGERMTEKNNPETLAAARKGAGLPETETNKLNRSQADLQKLIGKKVFLEDGTCVGTVSDFCTGSVTVDCGKV
jgi:hypothetical protein